jgi:TonB-linked SusC/RagA family outer membrane protein
MKRGLLLWLLVTIGVVQAFAQTKLISGKVTDAKDGSGLPGVSVGIKGTGKGALTSNDGSYKIEVPENATLIFSFIGYAAKEVPVGTQGTINVTLGADNKDLSEVVVTALGIKREKRTLGYASQEVKGDDIVQSKEVSFLNGLQGKVAGVQISNTSGNPGSGTRIVIRGNSSLTGNNQPLFVIDGNPISNDQIGAGDDDPVRAGGTTANRGVDIDPNIIESVNILRGASATALYGSRAAGGAIIITTKKGAAGKGKSFGVSFASSLNLDKVILPDLQNSWSQGSGGKYQDPTKNPSNLSWGAKMDTLKINGQPAKKYDPRGDFFRTGTTFDNNISVTGSTEKSSYLASYSSLRQQGVIPNSDYNRNSFYVNFSSYLTDKFKITTGVNYIDSKNNRFGEGNNATNFITGIYNAPISFDLHPYLNAADGSQRSYSNSTNNPFWTVNNTGLELSLHRFIPNISLEYTPLNWLTFTERLGADIYTESREYHEARGPFGSYPNGRMFSEVIDNKNINHDFYATARKNFDKFDLTVMLGNNIISEHYNDKLIKGLGLTVDNFFDITNAQSVTSKVNYYDRRRVSVYAQAVLEYNRMLSLTLTGRNDWSSSLPQGNNSYFYPSVTAAFVFSELPGLKDSKALSFGKFRIGYTGIGNDAKPYQVGTMFYKTSVTDGQDGSVSVPFGGANAFSINNLLGNTNLKPESIKEFEVGFETKWLNNRIGLDVSYYDKVSKNLIYQSEISAGAGYNSAIINAGRITNKGLEVSLNATPVQTRDFYWNISANYSKNKSMIDYLSPAVDRIQVGGFISPGIFLIAGQPYGSLVGQRNSRTPDGKLLIDDQGYPILEDGTSTIIGNMQPRWIGGVTNTFSYKTLTLSATFDGRFGGDILNMDEYYLVGNGNSATTNDRYQSVVLEGIRASDKAPNTTAIIKDQTYYRNYYRVAFDNMVQDGTFIKLRNVTLSYGLPSKWLGHFIKSATVSVAGRNLWIHAPHFTSADPELSLYGSGSNSAGGFINYVAPSTRSYNATVKLTF